MHKKLTTLLLSCLLLHSASAQTSSLLWKISGKGLKQSSYLFGTIHMICPDDFFLTPTMKTHFAQAKTIYMEINLDDPTIMLRMMQLLQLPQGDSLGSHFKPADYALLKQYFKDSIGMQLSFFQHFKPMMVYSLLSSKLLPCAKDQAYELEFVKMAKQQNKPIKGLERMEDQIAIFDSLPDSVNSSMIMQMVTDKPAMLKEFNQMLGFYKQQRVDSLYQMITRSHDMGQNQDIILDNRNSNWIPVMQVAMQQGTTFFAVGAGHLGGPKGVIERLRAAGYKVTPEK